MVFLMKNQNVYSENVKIRCFNILEMFSLSFLTWNSRKKSTQFQEEIQYRSVRSGGNWVRGG